MGYFPWRTVTNNQRVAHEFSHSNLHLVRGFCSQFSWHVWARCLGSRSDIIQHVMSAPWHGAFVEAPSGTLAYNVENAVVLEETMMSCY